ncbi:MAG: hypothetical protein ACFB9N_05030 [Geitlerinemataceae cyanobacterium]
MQTTQPQRPEHSLSLVPHSNRTLSAPDAHAPHVRPLTNSQFCEALVEEFGLSQCSPSLLRKFLSAMRPSIVEAGREGDLRDNDRKLTEFGQDAVRLYLRLDRDAEAFRREFWEQVGYSPIAPAAPKALSFGAEVDSLFGIEDFDLEVPVLDVEIEDVGPLAVEQFQGAIDEYQDLAGQYDAAANRYRDANQQIDSAELKALQKRGVERALRDLAIEEAAYQKTKAAARAKRGLG